MKPAFNPDGDVRITYTATYYTTYEQEVATEEYITSALASLHISDKNEVQKMQTIYDYITENAIHDTEEENSSTIVNPILYTAYGIVAEGKATSSGFAMLLYNMCIRSGIDCRIIQGKANGQDFCWNIVKLGSSWYNIDVTMDAERKQSGQEYAYYLKSNSGFTGHTRNSSYTSSDFNTAQPMSSSNFADVKTNVLMGSLARTSYFTNRNTLKVPVTITNGTGSGTYRFGDKVIIEANAPASGQKFKEWTGKAIYIKGNSTTPVAVIRIEDITNLTATYQ